MIKGGKGGSKTQTGLHFEKRINLAIALTNIKDYEVKGENVFYKGEKVAELFAKNKLYKNLLEPKKIKYSDYISKRLLPDEAILIDNTLYIIEMKFQYVAGSVDEKLQTCDFKRKQYIKLLTPAKIDVEYIYVLNDWFKKHEYKDVLDYVKQVGCHYYFNEIPLNILNLTL
ncbi:MAG: hypothetical protein A2W98_09515 [Bacteroidetes bacterium GWF2_33_38]|nr:MAG: hypothetical protein A2W98_09515 [Bacteroidetes bacterium GWF2_33_38]OFY88464.1 MAG: hypothetical protein A2236_03595 [Bacteroidetes bacterium RIFOXYA2_FULL_33_7]HBX51484.1 hypothetical protein [Bacteroidales bacterium]